MRDVDLGSTVRSPTSPEWEQFLDLRRRAHEFQGSDPLLARKHRELLRAAGFERTEGRASTEGAGSAERTRGRAKWLKAQLAGFARLAVAKGWADQAAVDAIAADIDAWAERPDAMLYAVVCETLGWVTA